MVLFWSSPRTSHSSEKTKVYKIAEGDTCVKVATKELGNRRGFKDIHRLNPDLGALPHRLVPGEELLLPDGRNPDAELTSKTGSVRVRPLVKEWQSGKAGMDLYRKWRVNSEKKSSALLTFEDKSTLTMRENSIVIIYGQPNASDKGPDSQVVAKLETGALRARMNKALGQKELVVQTPTSEATITGGSSVITSTEGQTTLSNHEGGGVLLKQRMKGKKTGKSVRIKSGMGSWSKKNKPPVPPVPLPDAPTWSKLKTNYLGLAPAGIDLKASWQEVPAAVSYRIEVALDPIARAVVSSVVVPSTVLNLEAKGFKEGEYYLSISSIDKNGLESIPNKSEKLTLVAMDVKNPDGSEVKGGDKGGKAGIQAHKQELFDYESEVSAPSGMTCGFDESQLAEKVMLDRPGNQTIVCLDSEKRRFTFDVQVGPCPYSPEIERLGDANKATVGQTIPLLFGVRHADGRELHISVCPEGELKFTNKTPHTIEGVLEMSRYTEFCELAFYKEEALVSTQPIEVAKPVVKRRPLYDIRWDAFVGIESNHLKEESGGGVGAMLGGRLSWRPVSSYFRGELEFGLLAGTDGFYHGTSEELTEHGNPAALMSANLRLMSKETNVKPFALVGAGFFLDPGYKVLPQIHAGGGLAFALGQNQLLAEIRGTLGQERSGVVSGMVGFSAPFGQTSP